MHGKVGKEVVYLSLQNLSQHFQVDLIAPGTPPQLQGIRFFRLSSTWFQRFKGVPIWGHLFNYFYFAYLWLKIQYLFRAQKMNPQVVYAAGPWMSLIAAQLPLKQDVLRVHRFYGTSIPLNYPRTIKNRFRYALKLAGYRKVGDLAIMTNDGTRGDAFLLSLGWPVSRLRFLTNGLHFPQLSMDKNQARSLAISKWAIPESHRILLTVSRLAAWKRVDRAIHLLQEILLDCPNTSLIIAGDGEEMDTLRRLVQEKGLSDNCIFTGGVGKDDLDILYRSSDVFITLYDHSNAGNPLFEAMVRACCIYTFRSPEVLAYLDEQSAVLVEPGNPDAEALKRILRNPEAREQMGENAQSASLRHFQSWEQRMHVEMQEILRACNYKTREAHD